MAKIFVKLILAGRKSLAEVPENYKSAVEKLLAESSKGAAQNG